MTQDRPNRDDRQNGGMPIQLPYPSDAPDAVARALRALSAPTRVSTIRYLLDHESATPAEIIESTAATAVHPALLELERLGLVTGDIHPGERRGKAVRYTLNLAELRDCLTALNSWLLPRDDA